MINLWDDEVIARTARFMSEVKTGRNMLGIRMETVVVSVNSYLRWLTRRMERADENDKLTRSLANEGP